jgi:hypothetical protein
MHDNRLPLKTSHDAKVRAGALVSERKPFSNSNGTFRGIVGRPDTFGWLPEKYRRIFDTNRVLYTIMSYDTPIAFLLGTGVWIVPAESYSPTTTIHQGVVRWPILAGEEVAA